MAKVGKPTPKPTARRVSPLKPGLSHARNWATAQMRAASYSRAGAMRMTGAVTCLFIAIIIAGLWLGGVMPDVRQAGADFKKNRLIAMGFTVQKVDVIGEGRIREDEVFAALGIRRGDYLFDIDTRQAQLRVQRLSWIDDAVVRRLWPDSIVVHIIERQPVALWQRDQQVKVIDASSMVIEAALAEDFSDLPLIVGENAAAQSQVIYDALLSSPSVAAQLEAIIHVGDRRWDLALKEGRPRIMLPENNPAKALALLEQMHITHNVLNLDIIALDLRIEGRLIARRTVQTTRRAGAA